MACEKTHRAEGSMRQRTSSSSLASLSSSSSSHSNNYNNNNNNKGLTTVGWMMFLLVAFAARMEQVTSFATSKPLSLTRQATTRHPVGATAVAVNGEDTTTRTGTSSSSSSSIAAGGSSGSVLNDDYLWQLRLNVFEKAKTVASVCTSGTLCTVSSHDGIMGAPFGSFVDYVLDAKGNPVLLMNEMSMHTINIERNALNPSQQQQQDGGVGAGVSPLVTLFTQLASDDASSPQGQDVSRCSFTCRVEKIPSNADDMDVIRMRYSLTHAYADQVMDSPKFAFYRLIPEKIYYVGGFGVMAKWVDVQDYSEAEPDILAKDASAIVKKLNREFMDDLVGMAVHLLKVEKLENIRVTNVDRLGMDVRVTRQQGTRRNKLLTDEFRIGFRIPVISVEDAKSEILKVFQEAWEKGNGMDWGDEEEPGSTVPIMKIAADSLE